jgi:hypothetical protein
MHAAIAARHEIAQRAVVGTFMAALFVWPFELPIAMGAHGLLFDSLGVGYVVGLHATFLSAAALATVLVGPWDRSNVTGDWKWFGFASVGYLLIGFLPLIASSIAPVQTHLAYQQLLCGFVAPIAAVLAIAGLSSERRDRSWLILYIGWIAFLLVSFLMFRWSLRAVSDGAIAGYFDRSIAQRILVWRFTLGEPWNLYGLYVGNANKMSNYLIVFMLLSVCLLRPRAETFPRLRRGVLYAFWGLSCVTLIILFSRAALLLLPLVFVASGLWRDFRPGVRVAIVSASVVVVGGVVITQPEIFDYLLLARFLDQTDSSPLGTFEYRFEQWGDIARYLQEHPYVAWFGMGTSGYGTHFFNSPEAGTHNMLLDVWMESGLIAPLVLLVVLAVLVVQGLDADIAWSNRRVLLIGTFVLLMLMVREHSASYLYVTSLGGFCFAALMYVALLGGHKPVRTPSMPGGGI